MLSGLGVLLIILNIPGQNPKSKYLESHILEIAISEQKLQPPSNSNKQFVVRLNSFCLAHQVTLKETMVKPESLFVFQIKLINKIPREVKMTP